MRIMRAPLLGILAGAVLLGGALAPAVHAARNSATYAAYGDIKDWDPSIAFSLEVVMLVNVYEPLLWAKAKQLDGAPNLQSMTWWPTYPTTRLGLIRSRGQFGAFVLYPPVVVINKFVMDKLWVDGVSTSWATRLGHVAYRNVFCIAGSD